MKKRLDTILLAAALFTVSGAMLAYNLAMLGRDGTISTVSGEISGNDRVISAAAERQLDASVAAGALPAETDAETEVGLVRDYELLPPAVASPG